MLISELVEFRRKSERILFPLFRCSAAVAQVTVNHLVVGSNPTTGARL